MTEDDLQTLLNSCTGTERRVYEALQHHGKMTDRQLRELLKSRGSGPRNALAKMLPLGLVRHAGKASTSGHPMQWEATPASEIDQTRERYEGRKPRPNRRTRKSPGARLAELRQMEPGDPRKWYPNRDKILAAVPLLTGAIKMAFWECVPAHELELALDEITELYETAGDALAAGRERLQHEKYKAKIEKLQRTRGRTAAEKEVAAQKVEKLSQKLIQT